MRCSLCGSCSSVKLIAHEKLTGPSGGASHTSLRKIGDLGWKRSWIMNRRRATTPAAQGIGDGGACGLGRRFRRGEITARLQAARVPVLMLRAESGFAPGQPPLFPNSMLDQMRAFLPKIEEHTIAGTTHYTSVLENRGASRIANLVEEFARSCQPIDTGSHK
jgi:hypothetical protein